MIVCQQEKNRLNISIYCNFLFKLLQEESIYLVSSKTIDERGSFREHINMEEARYDSYFDKYFNNYIYL